MSDLNQCNFIGRVGRDPEIKYAPDGAAVANFSIAVSESWKGKDGAKKEKTEWVKCIAWRKLAEIIGEYVHKGQQVFVSGKFTTKEWEKDGIKRYSSEIIIDKMQMLGSKPEVQDKPKPAGQKESQAEKAYARQDTNYDLGLSKKEPVEDDSIPF